MDLKWRMCDVRCAAMGAAHWAMDDDDVARSWELGAGSQDWGFEGSMFVGELGREEAD